MPNASHGVTVYAFEPDPVSCAALTLGLAAHGVLNYGGRSAAEAWQGQEARKFLQHNSLTSARVNTNYFLTCAAVSDEPPTERTFFAAGDQSSLSQSTRAQFVKTAQRMRLNVTTLAAFFRLLPWSSALPASLPAGAPGVANGAVWYVSQLKTDLQGHDLKAFRGLGRFLRERVVYATPEMEAKGYQLPADSGSAKLSRFFEENGFKRFRSRYCVDTTFLNTRLEHLASKANVPFIHGGPPKDTPKDSALYGPPELRGAHAACTGTR